MNNIKKNFNFMLLLMLIFVPVIGCEENSNERDRRSNGCRQENSIDTDTDTDMYTDTDYSKFVGIFKLVGITYIIAGDNINAGSYLGQLGVDWYGQATVTADGHVEGEFTMPQMAADLAGPFSYDIIAVTDDSIQVGSPECQTGSDWVQYSVDGEEINVTLELANFCKTATGNRPGASIFHFVKTTADDADTYPDDYSGNSGSAGSMKLNVESPVDVQTKCMIDTLMHLH